MPFTATGKANICDGYIKATLYKFIGLSSTNPATSVTEPSGAGYSRVAVASGDWTTTTNGSFSNINVISLGTATADWLAGVTLKYACAFDASGVLIDYAPLVTNLAVLNGQPASFQPGAIVFTLVQ